MDSPIVAYLRHCQTCNGCRWWFSHAKPYPSLVCPDGQRHAALPPSEPAKPAPLTRAEAVEACARAGNAAYKREYGEEEGFCDFGDAVKYAVEILADTEASTEDGAFTAAVLAEARLHPALADSPALKRKP